MHIDDQPPPRRGSSTGTSTAAQSSSRCRCRTEHKRRIMGRFCGAHCTIIAPLSVRASATTTTHDDNDDGDLRATRRASLCPSWRNLRVASASARIWRLAENSIFGWLELLIEWHTVHVLCVCVCVLAVAQHVHTHTHTHANIRNVFECFRIVFSLPPRVRKSAPKP